MEGRWNYPAVMRYIRRSETHVGELMENCYVHGGQGPRVTELSNGPSTERGV